LRDVSSNYDLIAVAFANSDPANPGGVTFSVDPDLAKAVGGYTEADFISDIQTLHGKGKKVIISVGGQNGSVDLTTASPNVSNFVNSMYGLITKYGFDGVDIDLENGISAPNLTNALQQLQAKVGSGFILTMAPQTIDFQYNGAYMQLVTNVKNIITVVHTQYYNSGAMNGCDGKVYGEGSEDFITAQACILLQILRPDQVALGLPASPSGAGGGYVAPSVVNSALDCLATGNNCGSFHPSTTYPGIRGAMDWSINWDASSGYQFANTVHGHFSALP
jgi:chitinase